MITSLSILIPTFNDVCVDLVKELHVQTEAIDGLDYEIIVADDGSTDKDVIARNKEINTVSNCRYIESGVNKGRAAIRNFLVNRASKDWLLFIDADMVVNNNHYIKTYAELDTEDVVYGGYVVNGDSNRFKGNLRYKYERQYSGNSNATKRNENPYNDFHTSNFLARRNVMLVHPFNENIKRYGYEDVIWGKELKKACINIKHIDNPLSFEIFENNTSFVTKTAEGVSTLFEYRKQLKDNSPLISTWSKIDKLHLTALFNACFSLFENRIKNNLIGNKPSVFLFKIYKLGLYSKLCRDY